MPGREGGFDGVQPGGDSGFAAIDFLAAAHETDDHCPVRMSVEVRKEKFRFGLIEARALLFPAHEVGGHFQVPSSLCFIENDNVIARRTEVAQASVAEVMDVLDESFHLLLHYSLSGL